MAAGRELEQPCGQDISSALTLLLLYLNLALIRGDALSLPYSPVDTETSQFNVNKTFSMTTSYMYISYHISILPNMLQA